MQKTLYSDENQILVQRIIEIRKQAGYENQRSFALAIGMSKSIIGNIETGNRRVDFAEFYRICKFCNLDPAKEASKLMKKFEKESNN